MGLFTADGCLYNDGRHLNLTSKNKDQIITFKECWLLSNKIYRKGNGGSSEKKYFYVQFGNVKLYRFLEEIGLCSRKSLRLEKLIIPDKYFRDFLRGLLDGDGTIVIFQHPESKHKQIRVRFYAASPIFIRWLQSEIYRLTNLKGYINKGKRVECLCYAKHESLKLIDFMYYKKKNLPYLARKFEKAMEIKNLCKSRYLLK